MILSNSSIMSCASRSSSVARPWISISALSTSLTSGSLCATRTMSALSRCECVMLCADRRSMSDSVRSSFFVMPFSLIAKCKCQSSHDSNEEKGAHSMHRHNALSTSTPAPVHHKPLERPLNVVVAGVLTKALVGQIGSSFKERICNLLVHGRMVQRGFGFFNSHFFSQINLSMSANLAAPEA